MRLQIAAVCLCCVAIITISGCARPPVSKQKRVLTAKEALADAMGRNDRERVKELLTAHPDLINIKLDVSMRDGVAPLELAATTGYKDLVDWLLERGATPNVRGDQERTLIHFVAGVGLLDIGASLISHGADVDAREQKGRTPLHLAAMRNDREPAEIVHNRVKTVEFLLDHGADVNAKDNLGATPLHFAVEQDNVETAKLLLDRGANISAESDLVGEPLHLAARAGSLKAVRLLVARGADVNAWSTVGQPLHIAASSGSMEIAKLLIARGAKVNTGNGRDTPLHAVVNHSDICRLFLRLGAKVNARGNDGESPLHRSVWNRGIDVARILIEKGAEVNARTDKGLTPLHIAAIANRTAFVKLLLSKGAEVNAKTTAPWHPDGLQRDTVAPAGTTPLGMATLVKRKEVARILREHGAVGGGR